MRHAIDFDSAMPPPREVAPGHTLRDLADLEARVLGDLPADLRPRERPARRAFVRSVARARRLPAIVRRVGTAVRPRERRERRHVTRSTSSADPGEPPAGPRRAASYA